MTQTDENCKFCISHILLICNGGQFPHGGEQQALNYAVSQGQVDDGHRAQAGNSRFSRGSRETLCPGMLLCEEESRDWRRDQPTETTSDEENGGKSSCDVSFLSNPGEGRSELCREESS